MYRDGFWDLRNRPQPSLHPTTFPLWDVLSILTEHKVKIGRDISLMGFDDIDALRMIDYRISVVDRDAREQGREAMRLLQECFEEFRKEPSERKADYHSLQGNPAGFRTQENNLTIQSDCFLHKSVTGYTKM